MSLQKEIMTKLKEAMKAKDSVALESLRAVKSAILLAQTETGAKEELTEDQELKILQKLVKQRKDSAQLFSEQGREDLATPELEQAAVITQFLPVQMTEEAIEAAVVRNYFSNRSRWNERHGQSDGNVFQKIGWKSRWKNDCSNCKKTIA